MKRIEVSYKNRKVPFANIVTLVDPAVKLKQDKVLIQEPKQKKRTTFVKNNSKTVKIGIYGVICEEIKTVYVGQSENLEGRVKNHKSLLENNKHPIAKLQKDYNLFKEYFNFQFLEFCDPHELKYNETFYIQEFIKSGYSVYNTVLDTYSPTALFVVNKSYENTFKKILKLLEENKITVEQLNSGLDSISF